MNSSQPESFTQNLKHTAEEKLADVVNFTQSGVEQGKAKLADAAAYASLGVESGRAKVADAVAYTDLSLEKGRDYVRANPIPAVACAFFAGVAVTLLLRGREQSFTERHTAHLLSDLRDVFGNVSKRADSLGSFSAETCSDAASLIESTLKKVRRSIPFI